VARTSAFDTLSDAWTNVLCYKPFADFGILPSSTFFPKRRKFDGCQLLVATFLTAITMGHLDQHHVSPPSLCRRRVRQGWPLFLVLASWV